MSHLRNIRTFIHVVKYCSFAGAARHENIANSVVSKRISQLEDKLGITLLTRTTRSVRLTDLGSSYHDSCIETLQRLDTAEKNLKSVSQNPSGRMRIFCGSSFAFYGLGADLAKFKQIYPDIQLEVIHGSRAATPEHEEFDLCLQSQSITSKNVVRQKIFTIKSRMIASPKYLKSCGTPQHPNDLPDHKCVFDGAFYKKNRWTIDGNNGSIEIKVVPTVVTNNVPLIRDMVINGLGIAIVPRFSIVGDIEAGLLVPVLPEYATSSLDFTAYYTQTNYVPQKVSLLLDFLAEKYSGELAWD